MTAPPNRLMSRGELMAYLAVRSTTLSRLIRAGSIPGPVPGLKRWDRAAVDAALDRLSGIAKHAPHDEFAARKARWTQRAEARP
jgi:hypothetical protein